MTTASRPVPIYCVASGHLLDYQYQWVHSGYGELSFSSPVVWVSTPGCYHCTVTHGINSCSSAVVRVEGIKLEIM